MIEREARDFEYMLKKTLHTLQKKKDHAEDYFGSCKSIFYNVTFVTYIYGLSDAGQHNICYILQYLYLNGMK